MEKCRSGRNNDPDAEDPVNKEIDKYGNYHKLDRKFQNKYSPMIDEAWYAYDESTGIECIWNTIRLRGFEPEHKQALLDRLAILTTIDHNNLCLFKAYWVTADRDDPGQELVSFTTEVFTSGTLRGYLRQNMKTKTAVQPKLWKRWCRQMLSGLRCLHARGLSHCNLGLDTVWVQHNGLLKIADLSRGHIKPLRRTATLPLYAPEVHDMLDSDWLPVSADVFAFGLMILQMATGEVPYSECPTRDQAMQKIGQGLPPDSLLAIQDECLRNFVSQCLLPVKSRPTAADLLQHQFLFEVPPLKVIAAFCIIQNRMLEVYHDLYFKLSKEDLALLNEIESGVWGSLGIIRKESLPSATNLRAPLVRRPSEAWHRGSLAAVKRPVQPTRPKTRQERSHVNGDTRGQGTRVSGISVVGAKDGTATLTMTFLLGDGTRRVVSCDLRSADTPESICKELMAEAVVSGEVMANLRVELSHAIGKHRGLDLRQGQAPPRTPARQVPTAS